MRASLRLPIEELGYALAAEYVSADGSDRSEASEHFTIVTNFQRAALFGVNSGGTRDVVLDEEPIRTAWDFSGTHSQPIGSWDCHNTGVLDLRRNGEQVPYSPRPGGEGAWFDVWWNRTYRVDLDTGPWLSHSGAPSTPHGSP